MNREEARTLLNNSRPKGNNAYSIMLNEALNMAIKALEQESCDNAVSRQDVLDLAKKGVLVSNGNFESVCKAINELPSVNPQPCEDAISREDALMCLTGEIKETDTIETIIARFVRRIRKIPSVNPTKTGHWEWLTENKYRCSNCKHETIVDECFGEPMYDFCPFCRARMESEE